MLNKMDGFHYKSNGYGIWYTDVMVYNIVVFPGYFENPNKESHWSGQ
jgi:hypothetical protein